MKKNQNKSTVATEAQATEAVVAPAVVTPKLILPSEIASLESWTGSVETGFEWNGLRLVPVDGGWSVQSGDAERRAETMNNVPYVSPRRAIAALRVIAKR